MWLTSFLGSAMLDVLRIMVDIFQLRSSARVGKKVKDGHVRRMRFLQDIRLNQKTTVGVLNDKTGILQFFCWIPNCKHLLSKLGFYQIWPVGLPKWDKHNRLQIRIQKPSLRTCIFFTQRFYDIWIIYIYIYMHTWYHTYALASNFFPSVFRANKLCPKISKLHFVESFRFCGFGHDFEVHRSGIRSSWGCKGCDVLNWSTKGAVSAKRVVDMSKRLLLFKGHCCFEEASSKIYKSKLFHDEMKNLIDSHESYHGTQSLGLISPSSQGPGVLWRLGPHP